MNNSLTPSHRSQSISRPQISKIVSIIQSELTKRASTFSKADVQMVLEHRGSELQSMTTQSIMESLTALVSEESGEKPKRFRLQIDFTPEAFAHLDNMKARANVSSKNDVARNALRFYDWYLEKMSEGSTLLIAKGDVVKQVDLII